MQYRKILHDATESCRRELGGVSGQHEEVVARLPQRLDNILATVADSVCQLTFADGIRHSAIPEDWRFYFWPGYDSVLYGDQPRRFAIRERHPRIKLYAGRRICTACVGTGRSCANCARLSLTAAAFSQTLTTHPHDIYRGVPFTPGSTHAWLSRANPLLPDGSPLEALVVDVNGTKHNQRDSSGFLEVNLPASNWPRWGTALSEILNDPRLISVSPAWPQAVEPDIRMPFFEASGVRDIWLALYNIWLAATFADERQQVQEGVQVSVSTLRELLRTLEERDGQPILQPLLRRAERLADVALLNRFHVRTDAYRFWYSLPVQGAVETSELTATRADLGSAMLLTNYPLTLECVFVIRLWVRSIYLMIRSFEATCLAHAAGSDDVRLALSHEVKKIANALGSHWIQPASRLFKMIDNDHYIGDEELGLISPHKELVPAFPDVAFVPAASMLHRLGKLLKFWSMSDRPEDLPFDVPESLPFHELLRLCWEVASDLSIVHCLRTREITNREEFVRFRRDMEHLRSCRNSYGPALSTNSDNPIIGNTSYVGKPGRVWLGRLLVAVLNNCVQHGHPMRPVCVTLTTDGNVWRMRFENSRMPEPQELDEEVSRLCSFVTEDARRLVDAMMAGSAGGAEVSKLSSSENTIKMCFKNLGSGRIDEWPKKRASGFALTVLTLIFGGQYASRIRGE